MRHRFGHWRSLSAIGAVAYSAHGLRARVFLMLVRHAVRSAQIIRFLKLLHQHLPGALIVIWDGVTPHRSVQTRSFIEQQSWLTVIRLPAYAPELNPVEGIWSWFKGSVVPNLCPHGLDVLWHTLRLGRRRLACRPRVLLAFLRKAGLSF